MVLRVFVWNCMVTMCPFIDFHHLQSRSTKSRFGVVIRMGAAANKMKFAGIVQRIFFEKSVENVDVLALSVRTTSHCRQSHFPASVDRFGFLKQTPPTLETNCRIRTIQPIEIGQALSGNGSQTSQNLCNFLEILLFRYRTGLARFNHGRLDRVSSKT